MCLLLLPHNIPPTLLTPRTNLLPSFVIVSHGHRCEEGHFACPSGNCISSWLCDGEDDCGDGVDESKDLCGKHYDTHPYSAR
uniref:Uncharacterized protein n=1 Tax=Electrophorus electricus TaxID=8005 RepID=A0AAY5EU76_ELEEL